MIGKVSVESALLYFPGEQQGVYNGTSIYLPFLPLSVFSFIILLLARPKKVPSPLRFLSYIVFVVPGERKTLKMCPCNR